MTGFTHVYQRTNSDCMLACIAMAARKEYGEVWTPEWTAEVVERRGADYEFTQKALEHAGFHPWVNGDVGKIVWHSHVREGMSREGLLRAMLHGRRAILSVPSLNHFAGWHAVFWDGGELFDPNNPGDGKQVYRWIDQLAPREIWIFDERPTP